MSDQHPDRPDDAPADPRGVDLPGLDLPSVDPQDADPTAGASPTAGEPPRDARAEEPAAPGDDDLVDSAPPAEAEEPADVHDRPAGDAHDVMATDRADELLTTGELLTNGPVHDAVDAPTADVDPSDPSSPATPDVLPDAVPDDRQGVSAPGDVAGLDGGVPLDAVHVDDDALVRPLDAPLAHVLGKDADDLSVLAAPADATDPDLPAGARDDGARADGSDAGPSTGAWDGHVSADDDLVARGAEHPSTGGRDTHVPADGPARHADTDLSTPASDAHVPTDAPLPTEEPLPTDGRALTNADQHVPDPGPVDEAGTADVPADATPPVVPTAPAAGAVPAAPVPAATAAAPRSGWSVLGRALQPRVNRAQVLAGVLCALLGFALAVQIRQTSDLSLSGMRQADLVRILDEATTRGDSLERERADLLDERDELLSGSDTRQAALDALRRSAETQGILAGRLPAEGRGVVVTVSDGGAQVKPVTMLNMLEELRNAGAEAMQLNDLRITASSAFTGTAGAVQLDGATLTPPYVWKAIGDPDTIATALQMPGGAFAEVRNNGGNASVEQQDLVEVSAIRVVPDPVHATPVPPAAG